MLTQHPFLSPEECLKAKEAIFSLRRHWKNRASNTLPFYTLGAASYLDADKVSQERYLKEAKKMNPLLASHFSEVYQKLKSTLAGLLEVPVEYSEYLALPGFHIFLANKAFESPVGSTHYDLQFRQLKWDQYKEVDFDNPISFTVALALPAAPAGLSFWDISYNDTKGLSKDEVEALKASKERHFLPYQLGDLTLHRGHTLHQIAPSKSIVPGDQRITLQGHGLICDGIMRLYW